MEQLWLTAARQCSLHSTNCTLHLTQQWRKGSVRLQQHIPRAKPSDGSGNESKVRFFERHCLLSIYSSGSLKWGVEAILLSHCCKLGPLGVRHASASEEAVFSAGATQSPGNS